MKKKNKKKTVFVLIAHTGSSKIIQRLEEVDRGSPDAVRQKGKIKKKKETPTNF